MDEATGCVQQSVNVVRGASLLGNIVGWAVWLGRAIERASSLPRVIVQAQWLYVTTASALQLGKSAGLAPCLSEAIGGALKRPRFSGQAS